MEVPAGVEPALEEPAEELPVAVAVAEAEEEEEEPEPVAEAEAELELSVAELEAEEEALVVEPAEVVVSTGGTEIGWPAEEHWATTALETAGSVVRMMCF